MYRLADATGHLYRFIVFGSFVTDKSKPNDIDVILIMADTFDVSGVTAEARVLFEHSSAEAYFTASAFWLRRSAILGDEEEFVNYWQIKRGSGRRGILEIISE
jgi:predicted nucleotidyltransferase